MWILAIAGCGDLDVPGLGASFSNRGLWVEETRGGDPALSEHRLLLADEPLACDDVREHRPPESFGSGCVEELAAYQQWAALPQSRSTAFLTLELWDTRRESDQDALPPESRRYRYFDPNEEPNVGRTGSGFAALLQLHEANPLALATTFTEADCEGDDPPIPQILQALADTDVRGTFRFSGSIDLSVDEDTVDARLRVRAVDDEGSGVVRGSVRFDHCEVPRE
ncbi:MAG: hypothetical protein H6737_23710 [Alphaproteobacteria bacterium]|nr:hypothetical protein [Alphaproteobacteria bacterium]